MAATTPRVREKSHFSSNRLIFRLIPCFKPTVSLMRCVSAQTARCGHGAVGGYVESLGTFSIQGFDINFDIYT